MKPRLAIVGSGIAGLGAAHFLHRDFDLDLFDANPHVGGHALTLDIEDGGQRFGIDAGFMVFNRVTYPLLCRLFDSLQVPSEKTSMSFSVQHRPSGLEYAGSSVSHLFAQPKNIFSPSFWSLIRNIDRFNQDAVTALADGSASGKSLHEWITQRGYSEAFRDLYLIPMSGAVWSTPPDQMLRFPALTLLSFFQNHGFLGLNTQHQWYTVKGRSRTYVDRLTQPFADRIHLNSAVAKVLRDDRGAWIHLATGERHRYERVILACHADQALALLDQPATREATLLAPFKYQSNPTLLHFDESVMPRTRKCWSAWNYRIDPMPGDRLAHSTHYWINQLQSLPTTTNFFVSLNAPHLVDESRIIARLDFTHPLFDLDAAHAQGQLQTLNTQSANQRVYFAGSYFRHGFHEDALASAVEVSRLLLARDPWSKR
jgi:predicted NAD/FAD-binding protein